MRFRNWKTVGLLFADNECFDSEGFNQSIFVGNISAPRHSLLLTRSDVLFHRCLAFNDFPSGSQ